MSQADSTKGKGLLGLHRFATDHQKSAHVFEDCGEGSEGSETIRHIGQVSNEKQTGWVRVI